MLTGPQIGELRDVIIQNFDEATLQQFLTIRLDKTLSAYTQSAAFPFMVYNLIKGANMEGWDNELIEALLAERPKSKVLLRLSTLKTDEVVAFKADLPAEIFSLEKIINDEIYLDPDIVLQGLFHAKKCMCRIEIQDMNGQISYGTGFLLAPDLIISNYHVFEKVIKNPELASKAVCTFDYYYQADGILNTGLKVKLHNEPFITYSEYSGLDLHPPHTVEAPWPPDKLDYALVRLEKEVGNEPFGINSDLVTVNGENKRGWINAVNSDSDDIQVEKHMIILQHPKAQPLKIAFGISKILGSDSNHRRVRYNINTEPGSSGAACFDEKFNWIALHNLGDPDWNPKYNQGVTAISIITDLIAKGITDLDICR